MVTAELRWFKEYKTLQPQMEPKSIFIWSLTTEYLRKPQDHLIFPRRRKNQIRSSARKRNSFGKGLGDILLKEGQTVESVIRDSLRQSFMESGYTVVDNNASRSMGSQLVDVEINKFWSWMNPGFGRSRWARKSRRISASMEAKQIKGQFM
jgi:hypothetical protein